ncbi:MAG: R2-like ligand-binding oxidase [Candidatus Hydrogenedentota bacterium]|jgi:ribonucleoside-diphosphate reductase beta chain
MAVITTSRDSYVTTTRGLNRSLPPMQLWEKAKKLGIWNPADIDFSQDKKDWDNLNEKQQEYILILGSQFISGEEAVTLDLLPLIKAVADGGHLEEEMFLTTFLWEEAKHIDFFHRAMSSWGIDMQNLQQYHTPSYTTYFGETFTGRMNILYDNPSPENILRASATYNMSIEGILAETGYFMWYKLMDGANILPGTREGVRKLQLDEARHIAYGVWLCSRMVAEHPDLFDIIPEIMDEGFVYLEKLTAETEERIGELPFDFSYDEVIAFGASQYKKRLARIEKARGRTLEELYGMGAELIEE